jgi:hypothetical protein
MIFPLLRYSFPRTSLSLFSATSIAYHLLTRTQPDWNKIGELLGAKPHTLYCRWNKMLKNINLANGGSGSGSAAALGQTFGSGNVTPKRKSKTADTPTRSGGRRRKQDSVTADSLTVEVGEDETSKPKPKKNKKAKAESELAEDNSDDNRERKSTLFENIASEKGGLKEERQFFDEAYLGV